MLHNQAIHESSISHPNVSLNEICARQQPPALLQALHERARWFHEYPTSSAFLLSLEQQTHTNSALGD